jgi:SpoVK/Ycf46/Vps4 family AAA+-type ATPase
MRAKYELLNHNGILRYEHDTAHASPMSAASRTSRHGCRSAPAGFDGSAPELDPPKGIMLLGVQGCGKSLAARACAGIFNVPLLRLDCAALFDKYVGESERNLRESLGGADRCWRPACCGSMRSRRASPRGFRRRRHAPRARRLPHLACGEDSRVFVMATANDISALPPELIRKGRFDEIFFVDLPNQQTRADILRIHAARRGINLDAASLEALAQACDGFAGAEIEQAVVAAVYSANAQHRTPDAQILRAEISATRPLAVVMAEKVEALREWADGRTVPAA